MNSRRAAQGAIVNIIQTSRSGDVLVATLRDPRIVGLVADLALAAERTPHEQDPVLAAIRSGYRRALRHLASVE